MEGTHLYRLVKKLELLKTKIKEWNVHHFKNILHEKTRLQSKLKALNDHIILHGMNAWTFAQQKDLKYALDEVLLREEIY